MANRKRKIVLRVPVTAEEQALIHQKMALLHAMIILLIGITALGSVLKFQADFLNRKCLLSQLGGVLAIIQLIEIAHHLTVPQAGDLHSVGQNAVPRGGVERPVDIKKTIANIGAFWGANILLSRIHLIFYAAKSV